jgi:hypothetical protein
MHGKGRQQSYWLSRGQCNNVTMMSAQQAFLGVACSSAGADRRLITAAAAAAAANSTFVSCNVTESLWLSLVLQKLAPICYFQALFTAHRDAFFRHHRLWVVFWHIPYMSNWGESNLYQGKAAARVPLANCQWHACYPMLVLSSSTVYGSAWALGNR